MPVTILVVEDDVEMLDITVDFLVDEGHTVFTATTTRDALLVLDTNPGISVLFTDIALPDIDGFTLADMATTRLSPLKIIYTTGMDWERCAAMSAGIIHGDHLQKPYRMDSLRQAIQLALLRPDRKFIF